MRLQTQDIHFYKQRCRACTLRNTQNYKQYFSNIKIVFNVVPYSKTIPEAQLSAYLRKKRKQTNNRDIYERVRCLVSNNSREQLNFSVWACGTRSNISYSRRVRFNCLLSSGSRLGIFGSSGLIARSNRHCSGVKSSKHRKTIIPLIKIHSWSIFEKNISRWNFSCYVYGFLMA